MPKSPNGSKQMTLMARWTFFILLCLPHVCTYAAAAFKIVTADQRGTYFAIGNDLAKFVAEKLLLKTSDTGVFTFSASSAESPEI